MSRLSKPSRRGSADWRQSSIVARFFVACLPDHDSGDICRRWRDIAVSTCTLWASLEIVLLSIPTTDDFCLLETWFARAKKTPLSITLRPEPSEFRTPILSLLSAAAGRLQSLWLNLSGEDCQFLRRDRLAFPNLKSLSVYSSRKGGAPDPLIVFHDALSLTQLSISRDPGSIFNLYPLLTSLTLCNVSFATVSDTLRACPQLLHLKIFNDTNGWTSGDVWTSSDQAPPAPLLSSFILEGPDLSHFTFPSLRRLKFETEDSTTLQSFSAFISRSSCALAHIALEFNSDVLTGVAAAL
ncbi:hypothetical protein DFH06DRAFT_1374491 [Mycena polygramma]|nr:hypothetical protein DFH06DRAFT_1374491 [Mycena polygramma]